MMSPTSAVVQITAPNSNSAFPIAYPSPYILCVEVILSFRQTTSLSCIHPLSFWSIPIYEIAHVGQEWEAVSVLSPQLLAAPQLPDSTLEEAVLLNYLLAFWNIDWTTFYWQVMCVLQVHVLNNFLFCSLFQATKGIVSRSLSFFLSLLCSVLPLCDLDKLFNTAGCLCFLICKMGMMMITSTSFEN